MEKYGYIKDKPTCDELASSLKCKLWNRGWGKMQVSRITFDHADAMPMPTPTPMDVDTGQSVGRIGGGPIVSIVQSTVRVVRPFGYRNIIQTFESILSLVRCRGLGLPLY